MIAVASEARNVDIDIPADLWPVPLCASRASPTPVGEDARVVVAFIAAGSKSQPRRSRRINGEGRELQARSTSNRCC